MSETGLENAEFESSGGGGRRVGAGTQAAAIGTVRALLLAGLPGLVAALGIHLSVGYLDAGHLAPPALALGLYLGGLLLSRPFLCQAKGAPPSP